MHTMEREYVEENLQREPKPTVKRAWARITVPIIVISLVVAGGGAYLLYTRSVERSGEWLEVEYVGFASAMGTTAGDWCFEVVAVSSPPPSTEHFVCRIRDSSGRVPGYWMHVLLYDDKGKVLGGQIRTADEWYDKITIQKGYTFKFTMIVASFSVSGHTFAVNGVGGHTVSIYGTNKIP